MQDLLKLWAFRDQTLSTKEIAVILNLSQKQTIRRLKGYQNAGWLTYTPGIGRGNKSQIDWHRNIENVFRKKLEDPTFMWKALNQLQYEDLSESTIIQFVSSLFFQNPTLSNNHIKIPIYNQMLHLTPLEIIDTEQAWILSNVYCRLVRMTGEGDLAYHWKEDKENYIFYIRPHIYWHNGEEMTMDQIKLSLIHSFENRKFDHYEKMLRSIIVEENRLIVDFDGPLEVLLHLFSQIEFSIQQDGVGSGPFQLSQIEEGLFRLRTYEKYHLAKPLISEVYLQTIPTHIRRKLTLLQEHDFGWREELEFSGTCYLFSKWPINKDEIQFFHFFASRVTEIDDTKRNVIEENHFNSTIPKLRVGYIVNQSKFVQLLESLGDPNLQVEHLNVDDIHNVEKIVEFDCLIVTLVNSALIDSREDFQSLFEYQAPLYESYRKMYYPNNFVRKGTDTYGYPNLQESYLIN